MISEAEYQELRQTGWKRQLTPQEQAGLEAWLAAHPEGRADFLADGQLDHALRKLPDVPVANNFTARLLQSVAVEEQKHQREIRERNWFRPWGWLRRGAFASVILAAGLLAFHQVQIQQRESLARSVTTVSAAANLPDPELLQDFDAIRALGPAPAADEELLALFQ